MQRKIFRRPLAEICFISFVVPENKIFYAALPIVAHGIA